MSLRVALHHATHYTYDRPIRLGPQVIRLRPAPHCRTPIVSYQLEVAAGRTTSSTGSKTRRPTGSPASSSRRRPISLDVTVDLVADSAVINPFDFFLEASAERYPFAYDATLALELAPYLVAEPLGERFANVPRGDRPRRAADDELRLRPQRDAAARHRVT